MELPLLEKDQHIFSVAPDNAPERQAAPVAQQKRYISDDNFVEILQWLRRFDLDNVHITSRKLRRLTEDKQMPRRYLQVTFSGREVLSMATPTSHLPGVWEMYHTDVDRAAAYLSYAFIGEFYISCYTKDDDDTPILPRRELLTAPDEYMEQIHIAGGVVNFRQAGLLDEVISACLFEQFSIKCLYMPALMYRGKYEADHRYMCVRMGVFFGGEACSVVEVVDGSTFDFAAQPNGTAPIGSDPGYPWCEGRPRAYNCDGHGSLVLKYDQGDSVECWDNYSENYSSCSVICKRKLH